MYGLWRAAPRMAHEADRCRTRRGGRVPAALQRDRGLCATFGLPMPALYVLDDAFPTPARSGATPGADLVVTSGLLRRLDPIQLEGVIAHELAHVKRGDNGVSCIGITLATFSGGERTLRRCVGGEPGVPGGRRRRVRGALPARAPRALCA